MTRIPPLTVCMFSNLYPPVYSGSATQCSQLSRELVQRGCQVVVVTASISSQNKSYEQVDGVHVYRLPAIRLPKMAISLNFPWLNLTFTPANIRRIQKIIIKHQPDVIHLHNHMFDLSFSAVLAARRFRIPLIITIHSAIRHPNPIFNWILFPADRWFLNLLVIRQAKKIICPDVTIAGYVQEAFGVKNTVLLPYGIGKMPDPKPEAVKAIREKYNLGEGPVILSLGHLHEIRNRRELIEALPLLLGRFPSLKLLIVGDIGTHSAEILASRLGVRDAVIFTGIVPHSEISNYLSIADLEAHWFQKNNPQNKTLGIASLEAMAGGKTVIGTADENVYGNGVLRNKQNVILIDDLNDINSIAKCITDLLNDKPRRIAIGEKASWTIREHFSWNSICDKTTQLYEGLIHRNPSDK